MAISRPLLTSISTMSTRSVPLSLRRLLAQLAVADTVAVQAKVWRLGRERIFVGARRRECADHQLQPPLWVPFSAESIEHALSLLTNFYLAFSIDAPVIYGTE